jgi:anti-sigma regulatory factor (Ser/Thr protein kinase)
LAALREARAFVRETLAAWDMPSDAGVILVIGELAANAVRHARSNFEISLRCNSGVVVAEVADSSPAIPLAKSPDAEGVGGRGLMIVETVARSWGFHANPDGGKVVWAEIVVTKR